jgi:hypothetical protein
MSEGFFDRWSRRKQQVREGAPLQPEPPRAEPAAVTALAPPSRPAEEAAAQAERPPVDAPPHPTLEDAQALTPESDFKPFVARDLAPEVRNAAMKQLFADPHFNVMDRMDVYIDDYSVSTPIPPAMLRKMASAVFMKIVEEEVPEETPRSEAVEEVAQSGPSGEIPPSPSAASSQPASHEPDDHADLRLQQDDAPRAEDPRRGTV